MNVIIVIPRTIQMTTRSSMLEGEISTGEPDGVAYVYMQSHFLSSYGRLYALRSSHP